jgi:hypothetical protein
MMHGVVSICVPDLGWDACSVCLVYSPARRLGPQQDGAHLPPAGAVLATPTAAVRPAETIDLPIFRSKDNSSPDIVNVRDLRRRISSNINERGRT